jgi:HEAT repeat protein
MFFNQFRTLKITLFFLMFGFLWEGCTVGKKDIENWGRENDVEKLIGVLNNAQSPYRSQAAFTLGNVGDRRAVEPLLAILEEENAQLQIIAISALGKIGDKRAVEPLIALLRKGYFGLSPAPVQHLMGGPPQKVQQKKKVEGFDSYQKKVSLQARLRKEAILALGHIGDHRALDIITGAIWDGRSQEVSRAAVETLVKMEGEKATEALLDALKTCNFQFREIVAHALARFQPPPLKTLIKTLEDKNACLREGATQAIGLIRKPQAVDKLIRLLGDENYGVQLQAAAALVLIGKPAVPVLIEALKEEKTPVRKWAGRTLGIIQDSQALNPLLAALGDESLMVRKAAASALYKLRKKTDDSLLTLLGQLPFVRTEDKILLIKKIAHSQDSRAIPALKMETKNSDPDLQQAAIDALQALSTQH